MAGANIALQKLADARRALDKAETTASGNDYDHEKDEQMTSLRNDLEKESFNLSAQKGLHEADQLLELADSEPSGGRLSVNSSQTYF